MIAVRLEDGWEEGTGVGMAFLTKGRKRRRYGNDRKKDPGRFGR